MPRFSLFAGRRVQTLPALRRLRRLRRPRARASPRFASLRPMPCASVRRPPISASYCLAAKTRARRRRACRGGDRPGPGHANPQYETLPPPFLCQLMSTPLHRPPLCGAALGTVYLDVPGRVTERGEGGRSLDFSPIFWSSARTARILSSHSLSLPRSGLVLLAGGEGPVLRNSRCRAAGPRGPWPVQPSISNAHRGHSQES